MFSVPASPGSKEWPASPPTLTEAGCHCGQFAGVVMKSKTRSMGWRIWMQLQMRVMCSFLRSSPATTLPLCLAANTHGEPDRFWSGPLHSMSHMARNRHIVALLHVHALSFFEFQGRFSAQHDDPLVLVLIVPKPGRAAIPLGNEALDLNRGLFEEAQRLLRFVKLRQICK